MWGWDDEIRADAPASRWRLGDARGSSTAADTVGGTAGSVRGSLAFAQPSLVPADADGAAAFNGIDSFVLIADRAGVKVMNNGAIEFVITVTRYTDSRGLAAFIYDGGARELCVKFAAALDGRITLRVNSVGDIVTSLSTIPLGVPTHVRILITTSGGVTSGRIVINSSDTTGTVTPQTITPNALGKCIGAADQGASNFFNGTIDELSIYNAVTPTLQRARAHYRAMFGVPTTYGRTLPWLDQTFPLTARSVFRVLRTRGMKVGDVIVLGVQINSLTEVPSHPDWTLPNGGLIPNSTAGKNHELGLLWHRIGANDPDYWDVALSSSLTCEGGARVVRGLPLTGDPIAAILGAASTVAQTSVPFGGAITAERGLTMTLWARYSPSGFPSQPDHWHYGFGQGGNRATVGSFERQQLGPGKLPYMTNFAGGSDAWTSLQVVFKDGRQQNPAINLMIGLDGVNSPNDAGNRGWPDGYTPALAIGARYVRVDFGPGWTQANADAEFADAARRGMRVLPLFWPGNGVQLSTVNKTTFANAFAAFCARYGPGGAFWQNRRDGYLAPIYFEHGNEPYGVWFVNSVEPDQYALLHKQAVIAARAANPRCKFLLACADYYYDARRGGWNDWITPMFAAVPDLAAYTDGFTVHLYGTSPLDLAKWANNWEWPQVDSLAVTLAARGFDIGGQHKFVISEFGFNTASNQGAGDYGMTEADQASQHLAAQRIIYGRWCDIVSGWFIYRYRDGTGDDKEGRVGIVRNDGTDKPAKLALAATVSSFTGAAVRVWDGNQLQPAPVYVYDGAQLVRASDILLP